MTSSNRPMVINSVSALLSRTATLREWMLGFGGKDYQLEISPRHHKHPVHVFEVIAEPEFGDLLLEPLTDFREEHRIAPSLLR